MIIFEQKLAALLRGFAGLTNELKAGVLEKSGKRKEEIEGLNADQLFSGEDFEGKPIRPFYRPATVQIKAQKGQPTDRVTLRDTGDFYEGITAQVDAKEIELFGSDEKTKQLEEKYGKRLIGLSDESQAKLQELLKPPLLKRIFQQLNPF